TISTAEGSVALNADGTFTYTPNSGATGADTFTYTASDANGVSNTATVTFNIVSPSPSTLYDNNSRASNTPLAIPATHQGILGNDSDPDGEVIQVTSPGTISTSKGSVALNADGTFTYMPNSGATGADTFTYTASDAHGVSNTGTVTFNIVSPSVSTLSG